MVIEVKNKDVFIPKYNGNDKLPDSEQIKVFHRFLLPGERKKYIYTKPMILDKMTGKLNPSVDFVQDEKGIAQAIITGFENLKISIDGKELEIKTVDEIYTHDVPSTLVAEIESHMLFVSPEVDRDFL